MSGHLPRLRPLPPAKAIRLTLSPSEAITMFAILHEAALAMDDAAKRRNTADARKACDLVWELEGRLSDKLTFVPVGVSGS